MAKKVTHKFTTEQIELLKERTETFNKTNKSQYQLKFKGQFCFVARMDTKKVFFGIFGGGSMETKIGRLKNTGDIEKMDFAVYKYSRENYDADEFFFLVEVN